MANEKETVKLKIFNQEDRLNVAAILIKMVTRSDRERKSVPKAVKAWTTSWWLVKIAAMQTHQGKGADLLCK